MAQGGEDLTIRLWDVREPAAGAKHSEDGSGGCALGLRHTITGFDYHPICVDVVNDGKGTTLVTGHNGFNGTGCMITLWDLRMQKPLKAMRGHQNTVRWVLQPAAFGETAAAVLHASEKAPPTGPIIYSASDDGSIGAWAVDAPAGAERIADWRVPEGRITTLGEYTPDGGAAELVFACRNDPMGVGGGVVAASQLGGPVKGRPAPLLRRRVWGP